MGASYKSPPIILKCETVTRDGSGEGLQQCSASPPQDGSAEQMDWPETPEGIALILLCLILDAIKPCQLPNTHPTARVLDIYAECLRAAKGDREVSHGRHH